MNKILPVLVAAVCISGFQLKAEAGTGAEVAGTIAGTVLCAGILTAAILDCDHHHRGHYYNREYYRERNHRHYRDHYYSGRHSRRGHHRCD